MKDEFETDKVTGDREESSSPRNYDRLRDSTVLKFINESYLNGQTWGFIVKELKRRFDISTSVTATQHAHKSIIARRDLSISKEDKVLDEFRKVRNNLIMSLEKQTSDLDKIWDYFREKDLEEVKISDLMMILKEQRERLKLVTDQLNRVEQPKNQTVNLYQASQDSLRLIKEYLSLLEKAGIITKNKPYPFETDGNIIDVTIIKGGNEE